MTEEQNELEGVPEPGEIVVGKYRVERILGVGGMGCVVAATHTALDQPVAIKFLLNKAARNPKNVMRFQREAQAAAKIKSDHVAKVSDIGTLDNGTPYMVMEYLEGEDLSERLQNGGRVAADEAVRFVLQACEALAEAHSAGIIHRDLKPANLFVARAADGSVRVKVLDFGISKIVDGGKEDLTKTSALMGSPLYMSPEQMMSAKAADGRADIWALGCILFELISGQPPFIGDTLPEICSRILTAPPTPLSSLVPIQPELDAVIARILEKNPDQRFQNLAQLAHALYRFGGEQAARSASIVCRVLRAPELSPSSHELPSSMSDASGQYAAHHSGQHPAAQAGYGATSASYPYPVVGAVTPAGHSASYPPAVSHGGAGYPVGAQSSQPGPHGQHFPTGAHSGMGAVPATVPNPGMGGHPAHVTAPSPGAPHRLHPALAQGSSTGAPLTHTMTDDAPRKSRAPMFIGLGMLATLVIAGGLAVSLSGSAKPASDAPTNVGNANKTVTPEPVASALAPSASNADPSPSNPEPSSSSPVPKPAPPQPAVPFPNLSPTRPTPRPPAPVASPPPSPEPQPPKPTVKPGDDRF